MTDIRKAKEIPQSSPDLSHFSRIHQYEGYTYGDAPRSTPSDITTFFLQQTQQQRENLRQAITGDSPLRLKGGAPQSEYREIIKEAMERKGHDYEDYVSAKRKKKRKDTLTEKERKAYSCYNSLQSRISKEKKGGSKITLENIMTNKRVPTEKGEMVLSHMSEKEKKALHSYRRKNKDGSATCNEDEIHAYRKYRRLLHAYEQGNLMSNEAGSSQQNAGSDEESHKAFEEWKETANSLTERFKEDLESWGKQLSDGSSDAESD